MNVPELIAAIGRKVEQARDIPGRRVSGVSLGFKYYEQLLAAAQARGMSRVPDYRGIPVRKRGSAAHSITVQTRRER